jgi:cadherin-like protein
VSTLEDTGYTFAAVDFGFSDGADSPANTLLAVKVATLPGAGTLSDNGVAVTAGQFVSLSDINTGKLIFTPAPDANGAGYAAFSFQVQDNGGTANGGVDLDPSARTMTIDVSAVNDAPVLSGSNNLTGINEDPSSNPGTLVSALIAGEVSDVDSGALSGIAVSAVDNTNGAWQYSTDGGSTWSAFGAPSTASARLLAADASTYVRFVPNANFNGTLSNGLTFRAWDQSAGAAGATADTTTSGGTSAFSTATASASITVSSVNDAPSGANNSVTMLEDTSYTFAAADFGFSDAADSPANALLAVKITTLPGASTLSDNGVALTAGQLVSVADIVGGQLSFMPGANANGAGYAAFTFQVQDDGGTAIGGVDLDPSARTMTMNVTAVNDAPQGASNTVTTLEDNAYTFAAADFGFSDAVDSPANSLLAVKIGTLPGAGTLSDNGVAVTAGQFVSVADIAGGKLLFTPAADANGAGYASFTFQVQDNGGIANGGVDLDPTARTMNIDVTPVNDAPAGANNSVTTLEDTPYTFAAADFGFSDAADSPANALLAVKITSLPGAGTLTSSAASCRSHRARTPTVRATQPSPSRCRTTAGRPTVASISTRARAR